MSERELKRAREVRDREPRAPRRSDDADLARRISIARGASRSAPYSMQSALALQRAVGNRVAERLLRPASRLPIPVSVQRRRLNDPGLGSLVALIKRLLLSGNKTMAEHALALRVGSQEVDKEDVQGVGDQLETDRVATLASAVDLKDPHKTNVSTFFTGLAAWIGARKGEAVDASVAAAPGLAAGGPDADYVELAPGPGKLRVQVPTAHAAAQLRATGSLRWSQADVKAVTTEFSPEGVESAGVPVTELARLMHVGGWRGKAMDVFEVTAQVTINAATIDMPGDQVGTVISKDNRRLLAATVAGLSQVPCFIRASTDALPTGIPGDKAGKAIFYRARDQQLQIGAGGPDFKSGSPKPGTGWRLLIPNGHTAVTYGELLLIRMSNQPANKATGAKFPMYGSDAPPVLKV